MAQQSTITATLREATGKGGARALRRMGQIPAVIYGHDRAAESLALNAPELTRYLASNQRSTVVDVVIDSREPVKAILREIQRNPVRPTDIIHIDLYEVHAGEALTLEVPVRLVGTADGVRNFGGVMDHQLRSLEVRVLPKDIPEHIDIDVSALGIGQGIHVRDLQVAQVEILDDPDQVICTVIAPRVDEAATEPAVEGEAAETGEPELIRKGKDEEGETEDEG